MQFESIDCCFYLPENYREGKPEVKKISLCSKWSFPTVITFSPPGFRMNASSWPMFLLRTLNGAEMAPATAFKKVHNASDNFGYSNSLVPSY